MCSQDNNLFSIGVSGGLQTPPGKSLVHWPGLTNCTRAGHDLARTVIALPLCLLATIILSALLGAGCATEYHEPPMTAAQKACFYGVSGPNGRQLSDHACEAVREVDAIQQAGIYREQQISDQNAQTMWAPGSAFNPLIIQR